MGTHCLGLDSGSRDSFHSCHASNKAKEATDTEQHNRYDEGVHVALAADNRNGCLV